MQNQHWTRDRNREREMGSLFQLAEYVAEGIEVLLTQNERNNRKMTELDTAVSDLTSVVTQLGADQASALADLEVALAALPAPNTADVDNAVAALKGLTTQLQTFDAAAVQADPKSAVNNPTAADPAAPESPTDPGTPAAV